MMTSHFVKFPLRALETLAIIFISIMPNVFHLVRLFFVLAWLCCICTAVIAQTTGKTIHLIVPYAAGGPIDVTARVLAERVKESLGTVVAVSYTHLTLPTKRIV